MSAKGNLTQHIVEEIGASIVAREYPLTQRALTEREVCSEFEVSRSIAREALSMLASKGLIAPNMSQGTWVQPEESWNLMDKDILRWLYLSRLSEATMLEFIQVRRGIEPLSAAYAARRATASTLAELLTISGSLSNKNNVSSSRACGASLVDTQVTLHTTILKATSNKALKQFANFIEVSIRATHEILVSDDGYRANVIEKYHELVDSLQCASPRLARDTMKEILRLDSSAISRAHNGN